MLDDWIVGDSPDSGRCYVVHAARPRFIVEIVEIGDDEWQAGAFTWLDEAAPSDVGRWCKEAAEVYFRWVIRWPDGIATGL